MKGADNGDSFATNTQIIRDYQTYYNLPDNLSGTGCHYDVSTSNCQQGGFYGVGTFTNGFSSVYYTSTLYCNVNANGSSNCSV